MTRAGIAQKTHRTQCRRQRTRPAFSVFLIARKLGARRSSPAGGQQGILLRKPPSSDQRGVFLLHCEEGFVDILPALKDEDSFSCFNGFASLAESPDGVGAGSVSQSLRQAGPRRPRGHEALAFRGASVFWKSPVGLRSRPCVGRRSLRGCSSCRLCCFFLLSL